MLLNTFCHIPGIGQKAEDKLWDCGADSWSNLLNCSHEELSVPCAKLQVLRNYIEDSVLQVENNNPKYFEKLLASREIWRIFPEFRCSTAYIDIETTGLDNYSDYITTIALYDGKIIKHYVSGINLDEFEEDIEKYSVIISYNGKTFDVPWIEKYFQTKINHAQIDLRYVLKSLGYSGGLKKIEKKLGVNRDGLEDIDGYFAVMLWKEYCENGSKEALETLLAYNIADAVNLERLMVMAYNMKVESTPFAGQNKIRLNVTPENPFKPNYSVVEKIKRECIWEEYY